MYVICRAGNVLLSRGLSQSTIGAKEFNGRVRDGIGFRLLAIITCSANNNIYDDLNSFISFHLDPRTNIRSLAITRFRSLRLMARRSIAL